MIDIETIISKSKIIKISNTIHFCIWGKWTVKIIQSQNQQNKQECWLHYNGVYVNTYYTDFKLNEIKKLNEIFENFETEKEEGCS